MSAKNGHPDLNKGMRAMIHVCAVLALLSGLKFTVGILTNASVLVADALHSLVDLSAAAAALLGIKLASRPPSERFPYGYYKAESFAALLVSVIILYGAYELVIEAIERWKSGTQISMIPLATGAAVVSMFVSYLISRYESRVASLTGSDAIHATSREAMADVLSSLLVLISILLSTTRFGFVESAVTFIISVIVTKIALENIYTSVLALLDVSPSKQLEEKIRGVLEKMPDVMEYRDLRLRKAGPFIFGEVTIRTHPRLDVEMAHEIADEVEKRVRKAVPRVEHFVVHVEPHEKDVIRIVVPVEKNEGLASRIAEHFGRAEGFVVVEVNRKSRKMILRDFVKNLQKHRKNRAGLAAAKHLLNTVEFDAVVTKEIGEISFHVLRDEGRDVYRADGGSVEEMVELLLEGKIEKMKRPTKEKE